MAILYLAYTLEAFGIIIHAIKYVTSSGIIPVNRHKKMVISLTIVGSMSYVSPILPHTPNIFLFFFEKYSFFILAFPLALKEIRIKAYFYSNYFAGRNLLRRVLYCRVSMASIPAAFQA